MGLYSAGYAEITSDWLVKSENEQLDLSAHIRVMAGHICVVLWGALYLILDSTTIYGVFLVMWYISIMSSLCDTKHLLSCRMTMALGLLKPHACLNYLPLRASLLTSTCDHPNTTKPQKPNMHCMKQRQSMRTLPHNADARSAQTNMMPEDNRVITTKEQILRRFPEVFEGIGKFPGKPYEIKLDPKVPPKQIPCRPIPIHLKDAFK